MIYAAPDAHGTLGTEVQPCSLAEAQEHARRLAAAGHSVVVTLAGGRYELAAPLRFDARDSGIGDATVTYRAADGERPVLTGASKVGGWTRSGIGDGIWEARTPTGLDTRQLYVGAKLAPRASIAVDPSAIALNATGFTIEDEALPGA